MDEKLVKILNKIESNGYEAYIIGGYVRDYLLGINSNDVDICTNALPKDILDIFNIKKDTSSYGSITIQDSKFNFDITTYRCESNYINRKPQNIEYTNNLLLDIKRRDFTINSLCMNSKGQVFDFLNSKCDIDNHLIKVIGDNDKKLTEDPLRILRAIRFSVTLDFELDPKIVIFIHNHKDLIKTLSYTRKKEELDKIFSSKNVVKGLKLIKELDLEEVLDISYDYVISVSDLLGIWSQIDFSSKYPFTKSSLDIIKRIRKITDEGEINNYNLFMNELYITNVAGEILGYSHEEISQKYHDLIIKDKSELAITPKDILSIFKLNQSNKVKLIYWDVLIKVLDLKLNNNYDDIKKYILDNWK